LYKSSFNFEVWVKKMLFMNALIVFLEVCFIVSEFLIKVL
jgi:hypothetical protein